MFGGVAQIHVEGEQRVVFDANLAHQALQLSPGMVSGGAFASYERPDVWHELKDVIRIEVVRIRIFCPDMYV